MEETESKHREAFGKFAEAARDELGDSLSELVLYGSVARGEETDESDVDILVVLEEDDRDLKEDVLSKAYDVTLETGVHVSVKILSEQEAEKIRSAGSKFMERIDAEGEPVNV